MVQWDSMQSCPLNQMRLNKNSHAHGKVSYSGRLRLIGAHDKLCGQMQCDKICA